MNDLEPLNLLQENSELLSSNTHEKHENNLESSNINNQLLFIDSTVKDYQLLVDNLTEEVDVIIINDNKDGIFQITETLSQYESLDAVHIVSHGNNGELFLGNTVLNQDNLSAYQEELNIWGNAIEEAGDILLYGCNVAADIAGEEFVESLSEYTQADILASDNITGNSELDGDWQLEYATGNIEAELIFDDSIQTSYSHLLYVREFDINLVVEDFALTNPDSTIGQSYFNSNDNFLAIQESEFNANNLIYLDDKKFKINTDSPNYGGNSNYYRNQAHEYKGKYNAFLYGFTTESLNFDYDTFDFSSISSNANSITFGFNNDFDISSLTKHQSIKFNFVDANKLRDGSFKYAEDTIDLGMLSFNAETVTFTSSSVSFEYDSNSLKFNSDLFVNNSNLFEYKLLDTDKVSFTESDFTFDNFNASDYKALEYAFVGDELFDPQHYIDHGVVPIGANPFTHYIESGYKLGLDPNPLFDVDYYLNNNPDVRNAGKEPLSHYAETGYFEDHMNRDPNPLFDTSYYNAQNSDVVAEGVNPLGHYMNFGNTENHESRDPNPFFDNSYYGANNPDVVADSMTNLEHWMNFGYKESRPEHPQHNPNRNPHPFINATDYYVLNDDVRLASYELPSANPVQHLMEFGLAEDRITHPMFNSEKIVKIATRVAADDENILQYIEVLEENNIQVEINDNNTFDISHLGITDHEGNFSPLHIVEEAAVLTFTIFAGASIKIIDFGIQNGIDYVNSLDFSEAPTFAGYSYGHAIGFGYQHHNLSGSQAFETVVFDETPRREIEVFNRNILDPDDFIFTSPETDTFYISQNTDAPLREDLFNDLLDGGIFRGEEGNFDGIHVVTSDRNGNIFSYNPRVEGNSLDSDWNGTKNVKGTLEQNFRELDVLADHPTGKIEIPARTPNSEIPLNGQNEQTRGLFVDPDGNTIRLKSVRKDLGDVQTPSARQATRELTIEFDGELPNDVTVSLKHVEGNAASIVRRHNLSRGTVVMNHELGPCRSCNTGVSKILKENQVLQVLHSPDGGKTWKATIFKGGQATPKTFNLPFK